MGASWTALVVSDEISAAAELIRELEDAGAKVLRAASLSEAMGHLIDGGVDVALADLALEGGTGLSVLEHLRAEGGQAPVLVFSLSDDPATRIQAFSRGCDDFLLKPVVAAEVVARVQRRVELHQALKTANAEVARLHELAVTDGLTQVANHRHFQERLREEFRRAQRYDDALSLILVDLDHFKNVNDNFGHLVGDEVLATMAGCVKAGVRETDFVARYGGEEFAVLLPHTQLAGALTVAERIAGEMKRAKLGPPGLKVTASFGVSGFPGRSVSTFEQLLRTADEALYRAKREGRDRISLFRPGPKA